MKKATIYEKRLEKFLKDWRKSSDLQFVKKLYTQYPKAQAFLVGGMVRDIALGFDSKDYDLVVSGVPGKKLQEFLHAHGTVNLVGKSFGIYKFQPRDSKLPVPFDIALPRTEKSFGTGGYKDVSVKSNYKLDIDKDLERRDFTINAMALQLKDSDEKLQSSINDPFNGLEDLERKIIRCVGRPELRFKEDYSRILRGIRFACQLDFEIATSTWSAIKKHIKHINNKRGKEYIIAREIIAKELVRAVDKNPVWAVVLLDKSGALKLLLPELLKMKRSPQPKEYHTEGDVWQHTILVLKKLFSKEFKKEFPRKEHTLSTELIWATLFHDLGKPYTITVTDRIRNNGHDAKGAKIFTEISDRIKLSSARLDTLRVEKLIAKHMLPTQAKEMKETTIEKYFFSQQFPGKELMMLIYADISATIPHSGKPDFSSYKILKKRIKKLSKSGKKKLVLPKELLNGHDIMKSLKLKPGKKIHEIKLYLRELQLKKKITTKSQALKIIKKKFK